MRGLNLTILRGYTGSDPEVREVGKTSKVAEVRLATDESYYNSDGELIEQTEWHSLVFWGNNNKGLAEVVEKYISKGSHIEVIGKLKTETWETDDNETRSRTKVVVSELKIISTPNNYGS
jgi:single-strand DNA-binding protein